MLLLPDLFLVLFSHATIHLTTLLHWDSVSQSVSPSFTHSPSHSLTPPLTHSLIYFFNHSCSLSKFVKISLFFVFVQGLCNLFAPFLFVYTLTCTYFHDVLLHTVHPCSDQGGGPLHFRLLIARASFGLEFVCTMALFLFSNMSFILSFLPFLPFSIFCIFIVVMMLANVVDKQ